MCERKEEREKGNRGKRKNPGNPIPESTSSQAIFSISRDKAAHERLDGDPETPVTGKDLLI